ncbi:hypothetical protein [Methylobacterium sp. Leaf117]|jgi:hypothetical protein|uniref:hypothetical protein n=1 Tax=Methylobacterium sp. Leaf117 TaxID=1736260 RepID=UPI0009EBFE57|nr:hypothetical protein [Methylobacterium sp. Leaf117]
MQALKAMMIAALVLTPALAFAQGASVQSPSDSTGGTGRPANLCQELVAFVKQPEAATKAAETPPQLATAVTAKKSDDTSAKPSAPGTPQNTSGQSGQITASGPGAAGPQGDAQNKSAPVGSTATASGPAKVASAAAPAAPAVPKPSAENVQQIENAAGANDIQGCRAVAQTMRRAGVVMPGPLLALAAMSPKLLEAASRP